MPTKNARQDRHDTAWTDTDPTCLRLTRRGQDRYASCCGYAAFQRLLQLQADALKFSRYGSVVRWVAGWGCSVRVICLVEVIGCSKSGFGFGEVGAIGVDM